MKLRTLILWVVLITLFTGFYQYFSRAPGSAGYEAPGNAGGWTGWPALALLLFAGFFVFFFVRNRRWVAMHDLGVSYLFAGQPERAKPQFELVVRKAATNLHRALSQYNLGMTLVALGDAQAALQALEAVEKKGSLKVAPAYHVPLPNYLALCCALLGDLPAAKRWLALGDERRGDRPVNFSLLPEMIILCRDGHPAAASNLPYTRWRDAETLSVRQFKILKLVEGLALHLENPGANQARILQALGAATPMDEALLKSLVAHWPELRTFLDQQRFGAIAA